ncbi:ASPIC/UnbV domain-containing protein [Nitritalea halalkaliphila LW7]|uniref:ASPIC/UnbV domain-containing protein n=1 Tax=Nitritalea halalkaliphila LW7 TaxID=1189621 RepID=I5C9V5_9BACT|nr:VCBS repeat-containing protein [Nitritalea halalkaliphila]EIM78607.1 ASPIC/UnbV domain-containing protein [Nitritalea halalkaliphila LW7]
MRYSCGHLRVKMGRKLSEYAVSGRSFLLTGSLFWVLIGVSLLWGCAPNSPQETEDLRFQLLDPEQSGLRFENRLTPSDSLNILEYLYYYNGGGVAIGDINGDGLDDIYLTANEGENKLFLNQGGMQFVDITASAGVGLADSWSTGATFVDINGDGLLDLYVCEVGDYKGLKGRNRLFINQGDLTFTEEAEAYGLDFVGFGTHAVFFDYDQDGDLDVYLLNHSIKKPEVFAHADTKFESLDL